MKNFKTALLSLTVGSALLLSACGSSASSSSAASANSIVSAPSTAASSTADTTGNVTLKVGASPAPHAEILEYIKPALAEQGITLEIVEFSDYLIPNEALASGDLDANFFQHLPYLENYNAKNGTTLVSAGAIHIEPLGIYPGKSTSLETIKDGAVVGIPNDTTNEYRALLLLQEQGLITLKDGVSEEAVPSDIAENPHNLVFKELEAAQLPASLPDLDFAVINGNYAVGAGLGGTALATEGAESPYVNIVAVRSGDETRPEIIALIKALQTDDVRTFINDNYDGIVVPVF